MDYKDKNMKKLFIYYLVILAPFLLLIYTTKAGLIRNDIFMVLFFFYVFIYRNITDYYRLLNKNVIEKGQFWDLIMPFGTIRYFRELYLP